MIRCQHGRPVDDSAEMVCGGCYDVLIKGWRKIHDVACAHHAKIQHLKRQARKWKEERDRAREDSHRVRTLLFDEDGKSSRETRLEFELQTVKLRLDRARLDCQVMQDVKNLDFPIMRAALEFYADDRKWPCKTIPDGAQGVDYLDPGEEIAQEALASDIGSVMLDRLRALAEARRTGTDHGDGLLSEAVDAVLALVPGL